MFPSREGENDDGQYDDDDQAEEALEPEHRGDGPVHPRVVTDPPQGAPVPDQAVRPSRATAWGAVRGAAIRYWMTTTAVPKQVIQNPAPVTDIRNTGVSRSLRRTARTMRRR